MSKLHPKDNLFINGLSKAINEEQYDEFLDEQGLEDAWDIVESLLIIIADLTGKTNDF